MEHDVVHAMYHVCTYLSSVEINLIRRVSKAWRTIVKSPPGSLYEYAIACNSRALAEFAESEQLKWNHTELALKAGAINVLEYMLPWYYESFLKDIISPRFCHFYTEVCIFLQQQESFNKPNFTFNLTKHMLITCKRIWNETTANIVAQYGSLSLFKLLAECPISTNILYYAAKNHSADILEYLNTDGAAISWLYTCQISFECLKYVHKKHALTSMALYNAITSGNMQSFRYLIAHACPIEEGAFIAATKQPQMLKILITIIDDDSAAVHYFKLTPNIQRRVCTTAAINLKSLKILHKAGWQWDCDVYEAAIYYDNAASLEYAYNNDCPLESHSLWDSCMKLKNLIKLSEKKPNCRQFWQSLELM